MSEKRYPIVIESTGAAVGDTKKETRSSLRDALAAYFEMMRNIGDPIPQPSSLVDYVEVGV